MIIQSLINISKINFLRLSLFVKPPYAGLNMLSRSIMLDGMSSNGNFFYARRYFKLKKNFSITKSNYFLERNLQDQVFFQIIPQLKSNTLSGKSKLKKINV